MFRVTMKEDLNDQDYYLEVEAPHVTKHWKPGQFVIIMTHEKGERVPLSVATINGGRVGMFIKKLGKTSVELYREFRVGSSLYAVSGPLGKPLKLEDYGTVVLASDAVCGHAEQLGLAQELAKLGNKVISIQTFKTEKEVYPEKYLTTKYADEHYITTLDGTAGYKGHYIDLLRELVARREVKAVFAGGALASLKKLAEATAGLDAKVYALVRTIMVDGTGMCGSCRVRYNGVIAYACRDGPWFDARLVDWDDVLRRDARFKKIEKIALEKYLAR
ncbi:sulfide/dihydroorotate dehydrogenase-like FAD/NAD-binding protein [Thermogladius calderae]|nr:sulfide/dihydroorotate dehydrogenase-like FAD/NAD-binding protein [Thermogladius calderae]